MNIKLVAIGKNKDEYVENGISHFINKIKHYTKFEIKIIPDLRIKAGLTPFEIKKEEAKLLDKEFQNSDCIILLDEKGKEYDSLKFADFIQNKQNSSIKNLVFVIGGGYGFDETIYQIANEKISFSKMTMNHQLIRIVFLEQLYRAFTILKGEKYHHS